MKKIDKRKFDISYIIYRDEYSKDFKIKLEKDKRYFKYLKNDYKLN